MSTMATAVEPKGLLMKRSPTMPLDLGGIADVDRVEAEAVISAGVLGADIGRHPGLLHINRVAPHVGREVQAAGVGVTVGNRHRRRPPRIAQGKPGAKVWSVAVGARRRPSRRC